MKLKLNTGDKATETRRESEAPQTPGSGIKLNLPKPPAPPAADPKPNTKKRAADPPTTDPPPPLKKTKTIKLKQSQKPDPNRKKSIIRLNRNPSASSPSTPNTAGFRPSIKPKHKGKLPPRPLGVGYDSECDEAEADPAIEENFILRMAPGPDAEYLRKAIEERKIGVPLREGGADANLRFFTKDGRRACVRVQERYYGAVLVDLPCIVESMKSWDKKGWWKSADVCQMLYVTGRVESMDAAREVAFPKEMERETFAWPHGLTPPMYDVRRRRFRKRTNYRSVEQLEAEVERLLEEDVRAKANGGNVVGEMMTMAELQRQEDGVDEEEEEEEEEEESGEEDEEEVYEDGDEVVVQDAAGDAEGQYYDDDEEGNEGYAIDIENAFAADGDDEEAQASSQAVTPGGQTTEPLTPTVADIPPPASTVPNEHAPNNTAPTTTPMDTEADPPSQAQKTPAATASNEAPPSPSPSQSSGSASDDDNDSASDSEELTEEAREARERHAQQKEEIAHLERQIAQRKEQLANTTNTLLRQKVLSTIRKFEEDRDVKRRGLGLGGEGDADGDGDGGE